MKLSEIKKSVTVALMTAIASESDEKSLKLQQDVEKQCQIVGNYLGKKFMLDCMEDARSCLEDPEKFDPMMEEFKDVGPRFSEEIEE